VEHEVYSVPNENGVGRTIIKVTRPPTDRWAQHRYGLNHDVISYLMRLDKMNRLAADLDYKVIGVTTTLAATKAWPSIVTSMKHIIGEEPNPKALAFYLMALGFKDEGLNAWAHAFGFKLGDVHTGNFIETPDGRMVPIDVTVEGEC
jgi:hypothetical protein